MPAPVRTISAATRQALRNAVLSEPLEQIRPRVLSGGFVIAGTVVREEAVACFRIHDDLGVLAGIAERAPHPFHLVQRNTVVLASVEADQPRLQLGSHVQSGPSAILVLQSD